MMTTPRRVRVFALFALSLAVGCGGAAPSTADGPSPDAGQPRPTAPDGAVDAAVLAIDDAGVTLDAGGCPEGRVGSACEACAEGLQDEDGDGRCLPSCDPFYCGPEGACAIVDGARSCTCSEGYAGEVCAECAPGFVVDATFGCLLAELDPAHVALWLDSSVAASLELESVDQVATWRDRRGPEFGVLGTSSPRTRPTLARDARGIGPRVRFDGANDELVLEGHAGLSGGSYTVFIVYQQDVDSGGLFEARSGGSTRVALSTLARGASVSFVQRGATDADGVDSARISGVGSGRTVVVTLQRTAGGEVGLHQVTALVDGTTRTMIDQTTPEVAPIGAPVALHLGVAGEARLQGEIAELIILDELLADEEAERVEAYLGRRHGLLR